MDRAASWHRRLHAWLDERFPPGPYTVLVLLFHASAVLVAAATGGGGRLAPAAAIVTWLVFLHLRIFDEHKDFHADVVAHPQRVLSRGIVTLSELSRLAVAIVVAEAALAASLGAAAFAAWVAVLAFSVGMRFEFGVGRWLSRHIVVYAITHNPIVALLALFLHTASGAALDPAYLWYVALVSAGSLAFELGRKIRLPHEELAGVPSYSSELGQGGARALLGGVLLLTAGSLVGLLLALEQAHAVALALAAAAVAPGLIALGSRSRRVELGASLALLSSLAIAGGVAWRAA